LRSRVLAYVASEREAGQSYRAIATALGVPAATVPGWSAAAKAARGTARLRPVRVAQSGVAARVAEERLALVAPGGYRVEGLTLEGVRVLLRALGA
jgi:transposase